jgi:hypothetical protein
LTEKERVLIAPPIAAEPGSLPDRICLPFAFDAQMLGSDLARISREAWVRHFVRDNYSGEWSILPLRCRADAMHPSATINPRVDAMEFVDTPFLEMSPAFRKVLARLECPKLSVRLMRLTPGSEIKEHCDPDLAAEHGLARLHVPITTSPDVDFYLNGTTVAMAAGSCWYLRLSDPHRVVNRGAIDRVHLVIDVVVNEWLGARLGEAARGENSNG